MTARERASSQVAVIVKRRAEDSPPWWKDGEYICVRALARGKKTKKNTKYVGYGHVVCVPINCSQAEQAMRQASSDRAGEGNARARTSPPARTQHA